MFKKLNIFKKDNLIWTEIFNTQEDLDKWLNEEKTRSYWDNNVYIKIEEINESKINLEEIEKINQEKKQKKYSAIKKLEILGLNSDEISALLGE